MEIFTSPDLPLMEKAFWTILWILLILALTVLFLRTQERRQGIQDGSEPVVRVGVALAVAMCALGVCLISVAFPYGLHHLVLDVVTSIINW